MDENTTFGEAFGESAYQGEFGDLGRGGRKSYGRKPSNAGTQQTSDLNQVTKVLNTVKMATGKESKKIFVFDTPMQEMRNLTDFRVVNELMEKLNETETAPRKGNYKLPPYTYV